MLIKGGNEKNKGMISNAGIQIVKSEGKTQTTSKELKK